MLSKTIEVALNEQINKEIFSAYLYLSMSSYAETEGLKGISVWFKVQYHEEMVHSMKFYEYILKKGGKVALKQIDSPDTTFDGPLDLFKKALNHEEYITESIDKLVDLAIAENEHATKTFLDWYVTEQVEEEQNVTEIIQTLKMIGDNKAALFLYDKELGARTVTVPTDFSKGVSAQMSAAG
jgi:ferritin